MMVLRSACGGRATAVRGVERDRSNYLTNNYTNDVTRDIWWEEGVPPYGGGARSGAGAARWQPCCCCAVRGWRKRP